MWHGAAAEPIVCKVYSIRGYRVHNTARERYISAAPACFRVHASRAHRRTASAASPRAASFREARQSKKEAEPRNGTRPKQLNNQRR